MIIKSAAGVAFAAACLTTIATLPAAHAQMAGTYGNAPGAYGTAPPPAAYPAPGRYVPPPPDQPAPGGTQVMTNGPQTNPGDISPSWSAQRNVAASERYDRLLETNRGFRQARIRKECVRSPIRNFASVASTVSRSTNLLVRRPGMARQPRPLAIRATSAADPSGVLLEATSPVASRCRPIASGY
jgi:hypothetical protein